MLNISVRLQNSGGGRDREVGGSSSPSVSELVSVERSIMMHVSPCDSGLGKCWMGLGLSLQWGGGGDP